MVETFEQSTNKRRYYKTFETSVINSPLSLFNVVYMPTLYFHEKNLCYDENKENFKYYFGLRKELSIAFLKLSYVYMPKHGKI